MFDSIQMLALALMVLVTTAVGQMDPTTSLGLCRIVCGINYGNCIEGCVKRGQMENRFLKKCQNDLTTCKKACH